MLITRTTACGDSAFPAQDLTKSSTNGQCDDYVKTLRCKEMSLLDVSSPVVPRESFVELLAAFSLFHIS